MDEKSIYKMVDKIMEDGGTLDEQKARESGGREAGTRVKMDARTEPRREPETPMRYQDWLKQQPKSITIGIHKKKKK